MTYRPVREEREEGFLAATQSVGRAGKSPVPIPEAMVEALEVGKKSGDRTIDNFLRMKRLVDKLGSDALNEHAKLPLIARGETERIRRRV